MFCHLSEIGVQRKKALLMFMRKHQAAARKTVLPNIVAISAIIIQLIESNRGQMRNTSIN